MAVAMARAVHCRVRALRVMTTSFVGCCLNSRRLPLSDVGCESATAAAVARLGSVPDARRHPDAEHGHADGRTWRSGDRFAGAGREDERGEMGGVLDEITARG